MKKSGNKATGEDKANEQICTSTPMVARLTGVRKERETEAT